MCLGDNARAYTNQTLLLQIALDCGVTAIHPGLVSRTASRAPRPGCCVVEPAGGVWAERLAAGGSSRCRLCLCTLMVRATLYRACPPHTQTCTRTHRYGFLSENDEFCHAVETAGITWLGPRASTMYDFALKHVARSLAAQAGVSRRRPVWPCVPQRLASAVQGAHVDMRAAPPAFCVRRCLC